MASTLCGHWRELNVYLNVSGSVPSNIVLTEVPFCKSVGGMARKLRLEYAGAIYHVMNRGDRGEPIFKGDADRVRFLETLGEACAKTDWEVQAYCLIGYPEG